MIIPNQPNPQFKREEILQNMQHLVVISNAIIISLILVKLLYVKELVAVGRDPM